MIKRYLWAVGEGVESIAVGESIGDRYLCKAPRIFLDTQPALSPDTLDSFPEPVLPYLRLNAYQLHVPQAYGWMQVESTSSTASAPVMLLEYAAIAAPVRKQVMSGPISSKALAEDEHIQIFPSISDQWGHASAMRQLNWLWQIAKLWQPLATERVVSSLLNPDLIRIEDSLIRLLELQPDHQRQTEGVGASLFNQLGNLWLQWLPDAQPTIQPFLDALCRHLVEGNIKHPGQLVACLDRALNVAGKSQARQIQLASQTDKGPSRPRNEDACYPKQPGTVYLNSKRNKKTAAQLESSMVMVCDGIGGHLGGAIASGLAIEEIYQHLRSLSLGRMSPLALITELRKATCAANDSISDRNDQEERRDRERMGTTLVMGLVQNHELYVTHLGDSRAYLITHAGCHQVTLDDDVASREARLGYGTYRSALTHPGSGSLVQALGMGPSGALHPTVQRFVLDGEGVMLLCSDGLSDNDLVDGLWQSYILPLLDSGVKDLGTITKKLIDAANSQNGHDNVTVSLIRWATQNPSKFTLDPSLATPPTLTSSIPSLSNKTRLQNDAPTEPQVNSTIQDQSPTKLVSPDVVNPSQSAGSSMGVRSIVSLLFGIVFLLSLGGVLAYVLLPSVSDRIDALLNIDQESYTGTPASINSNDSLPVDDETTSELDGDRASLRVGSFIQISRSDLSDQTPSNLDDSQPLLMLYPEPSLSGTNAPPPTNETDGSQTAPPLAAPSSLPDDGSLPGDGIEQSVGDAASNNSASTNSAPVEAMVSTPTPIVAGTILKMISQQEGEGQVRWVRLRVCHVPLSTSENIVSGETEESIPSVAPSEVVLRSGDTGWIAENQLRSVIVLNPGGDASQLIPCEAP